MCEERAETWQVWNYSNMHTAETEEDDVFGARKVAYQRIV